MRVIKVYVEIRGDTTYRQNYQIAVIHSRNGKTLKNSSKNYRVSEMFLEFFLNLIIRNIETSTLDVPEMLLLKQNGAEKHSMQPSNTKYTSN